MVGAVTLASLANCAAMLMEDKVDREGAGRVLGWRTLRPSWELPEKERVRLPGVSSRGAGSGEAVDMGLVLEGGDPLVLAVRVCELEGAAGATGSVLGHDRERGFSSSAST